MNTKDMQEHLDELVDALYCRLDQEPEMAGMMYVEFGYLEGPTIDDSVSVRYPNAESRYLTCLHELGHQYHAHTQGRPWNEFYESKSPDPDFWKTEWEISDWYFENGVLRSEAQAWNYALDKCLIPSDKLQPETRAFMWDTCLGSYFNHARSVGFDTPGQKLYNGDRAYVEFAYGRPDKYFYQTKRRILEGDVESELPKKKTQPPRYTQTFRIDTNSADWTTQVIGSNNWITYGNTYRRTGS